jgi:hypothetical protein
VSSRLGLELLLKNGMGNGSLALDDVAKEEGLDSQPEANLIPGFQTREGWWV